MISNAATFEESPPVGTYSKKPTTQYTPLWGAHQRLARFIQPPSQ